MPFQSIWLHRQKLSRVTQLKTTTHPLTPTPKKCRGYFPVPFRPSTFLLALRSSVLIVEYLPVYVAFHWVLCLVEILFVDDQEIANGLAISECPQFCEKPTNHWDTIQTLSKSPPHSFKSLSFILFSSHRQEKTSKSWPTIISFSLHPTSFNLPFPSLNLKFSNHPSFYWT
jgi:hypothetical protein